MPNLPPGTYLDETGMIRRLPTGSRDPRSPGAPPPGGLPPAGGAGDWFSQQGAPPAVAPPPPPGPPIQNGAASSQQALAALQSSPGYQFRLGEGLKALERSAAARGTLLTGGTLKGLERYGQDYASNEYDKRNQQLFGWAGMGLNAASAQTGANTNYATTAGDLMTQQGNAQAAGTVGGANAWNQFLGQAPGNIAQMYYLSQLMQPQQPTIYTDPIAMQPGRTVPIPTTINRNPFPGR